MGQWRLISSRVRQAIPILVGITIVSFVLIRLVPGDPARVILGTRYSPESAARLRADLGLNDGILKQYWHFVSHVATGDLGHSYALNSSVRDLVGSAIGPTLLLILLAGLGTTVISLPLGVLSGLRKGGVLDQSVRVFLLVSFALPGFLLGVLLILLFAIKLPWFPVSGYGSGGIASHLEHLMLPAITLALPFSAVMVRSLQASVHEALMSDYATTALLKGLSWPRIVVRHILRNAITSVVVVFGVNLAFLVGGTVVVENVFSLPGVGSLLVDAVSSRDYPVIQALTLLFATAVLAVNLLTDVVHIALDPRLAGPR